MSPSTIPRLSSWLVLLLVAVMLSFVSPQSTVLQGALMNGAAVVVAISQGDTHSWSFNVDPSQAQTGTALTDLVFVVQSSIGRSYLYITPPGPAAALQSTSLAGGNGVLLTNRSGTDIPYGSYLVQVLGVAADTYTLSVTLSQRRQITAGEPLTVGAIYPPLTAAVVVQPAVFTYVDYVVQQGGPWQMTLALTVDEQALIDSGGVMSSLVLPTVYWARGMDVSAWSPLTTSTWSTAQSATEDQLVNSIAALASTYDECVQPPCRYSFLIAVSAILAVLPSMVVHVINLSTAYSPALDYSLLPSWSPGLGQNVSISTPATTIQSLSVDYYRFPVYDPAVDIVLMLGTTTTCQLVVLLSQVNPLPDLAQQSFQWSLSASGNTMLNITHLDPYFIITGRDGYEQSATMEGTYYVTVYGYAGTECTYQLSMTVADATYAAGPGAPLLPFGVLVTVPEPVYTTYFTFRIITPPGFDSATTDIVVGASKGYALRISDTSTTPGYSSSIVYQQSQTGQQPFTLILSSALGQVHVGTFWVALETFRSADISASLVTHTPLQAGSTFHSTQSHSTGQAALFEWSQVGLSAVSMRLALDCSDPTEYGSLYISTYSRSTPQAAIAASWPVSQETSQWSAIGGADSGGLIMGHYNYSCTATVDCVWLISVIANSPTGLANFSLTLDQDSTDPPLTALSLKTTYSSTATQEPFAFYFVVAVTQLAVLTVTLATQGTGDWQLWVDRDRSLLYALARQPEYAALALQPIAQATLTISPADAIFGVDAADNIGSPFIGSFYIQLTCSAGCSGAPYQLNINSSQYNGSVGLLRPLAVTVANPIYQSLLSGSYAYYSFLSPVSVTASTDLTFAVVGTGDGSSGSPSIYISTLALFPSLVSGVYNYTSTGSNAASVLLSGAAIAPSTVYYVGVLAGAGSNLNFSFTVSLSTRTTLSGAGSFSLADPLSAGSVVYVDLTLPGSLTRAAQPTYTFLAAVMCSTLSGGQLPALMYSSSLQGRAISSVPPSLTSVSYNAISSTQPAPTGAFWSFGGQLCTLTSCVWHIAVLMPAGAAGCTFAISNLQSGSSQQLAPTSLPVDGTLTAGTVATATASWYTFAVPSQLLAGAEVTVKLTPSSLGVSLNLQLSASGFPLNPSDGFSASARAGSVAVLSFNSSAAPDYLLYSSPVTLRSLYFVGVGGVSGGSYTLSVSITPIAPLSTGNVTDILSLDPSVGSSVVVVQQRFSVIQLAIPASYSSSTDVIVLWESQESYGMQLCAVRNLLLPLQYCTQVASTGLPSATPRVFYYGEPYVSLQLLTFNSILTPEVQPGDTIYLYTSSPVATLTLFIQQRLQPALGQAVQLTLSKNQPTFAQVSVPASQVSGSWQTPISFLAALTTSSIPSTSSTQLPAVLYLRSANEASKPLQPNTYNSNNVRTSKGAGPTQALTVNDVCTISVCTWSMLIWSREAVNVSFGITPPGTSMPIVPGFTSAPTFVGQDAINTHTFALPHAHMAFTISLQSLSNGQYAGNNTNTDLYVSTTSTRPGPDNNAWFSQADTPFGLDTLTVDLTAAQPPANTTYYVGVFGQRSGWYTLIVTAADAATGQSIILSLNTLVSGATNVQSSQYYQYQIGQVDEQTDLSLVLVDTSGNQTSALPHPQLYATFSYTQPGPVAGWLPPLLPYELLPSTSSAGGVQQITLNTALSSSNLLPLVSQHSLYVAVYGSPSSIGGASGETISLVPYSVCVSVTERVLLATDNSVNAAIQFTRVSAGTVQYYQLSFTASSAVTSAVLALTGQNSPVSALPSVYIADPSITALVDPVMSTPQSYSAVMSPAPSTLSSVAVYNALMMPLTTRAVCTSTDVTGQSGCVWKAMVFNALPMSSYSFAVTTATAASIQPLLPNTPVTASRAGGLFAYYSFALAAGVSTATVTLITLDQAGNVDLFVSTTNLYPYYAYNSSSSAYAGSQWQSTVDGGASQPDIVWLNSSSGAFMAPATYYVAVFAQRAAAFTLTLVVQQQPSGTPSSSTAAPMSLPSSSSPSSRSSSTGYLTSPLSAASSSPNTAASVSASITSGGISSISSSSSSSSVSPASVVSSDSSGLSSREVAMLASFVPALTLLCVLVVLLAIIVLRRGQTVNSGKERGPTRERRSGLMFAADNGLSGAIEMSTRSDQADVEYT